MNDKLLREGMQLQDEIIHVQQIHDLLDKSCNDQILIQYGNEKLSIPYELAKKFEIESWSYLNQLRNDYADLK